MSIRKKTFSVLILALLVISCLSGCKKKEEPTGPVDEVLTAVTLNDLTPGNFYVKSGNSFYLLPVEDLNYDRTKPAKSTDSSENGMVDSASNRLIDFIYKDMAIPTLYKNDQLIYVSDGSISSYTWERFKDYGYSIGISDLYLSDAGKIKSNGKTRAAVGSTAESAIGALSIPEGSDITVDTVNGTSLDSKYLNDGGIITGMSKDANAEIDLYVGTQHVPVTATADTRYFKSFELYKTDNYSLSTDGYAIVEIPSYFKSGYYMINNTGFVKFLNVDRGVDESGIDLNTAYYYTGKDGNTLTFYEWQEENGLLPAGSQQAQQAAEIVDYNNFNERSKFIIDSTQQELNISIAYKYINDEYRIDANKNGTFPKVYLMDPSGNYTVLKEDESKTYGSGNKENYTYLSATLEAPVAGEYYLLYDNFTNIQKIVDTDLRSGNATSYIHNGNSGNITIYYEESPAAHDITITWEKSDRAAKSIVVTTPDGVKYSVEDTPGNIMANEYGRFIVKIPYVTEGNYKFDIKGENLGRVWVNSAESVSLNNQETMTETQETQDGTIAETAEGESVVQ